MIVRPGHSADNQGLSLAMKKHQDKTENDVVEWLGIVYRKEEI